MAGDVGGKGRGNEESWEKERGKEELRGRKDEGKEGHEKREKE